MNAQPLIDHIRTHSNPLDPVPTGEPVQVGLKPGIRAVVFDVYGTLFISGSGDISLAQGEDRSGSLIASLETAGFTVRNPEQWRDDLRVVRDPEQWRDDLRVVRDHDTPWSELFMKTLADFRSQRKAEGIQYPEVRIQEVWKRFIEEAATAGRLAGDGDVELAIVDYECRVNPCWPMPNLSRVLERIAQSGLQLGIVSNAQFYTPLLFPALIEKRVEDWGFDPGICVWSYVQREGKPSMNLYRLLAEKLAARQIRPDEVLYVGNDLRNDVWPAAALGFHTCLFAGDKRSLRWRKNDPDCCHVRPDYVVNDLQQILDILQ